jgi:hypothetical protein
LIDPFHVGNGRDRSLQKNNNLKKGENIMDKKMFLGTAYGVILLLVFSGIGFAQSQGAATQGTAKPAAQPAQSGPVLATQGGPTNPNIGPHVGDGPTGQDFINLFDLNKDGKVDHDEWEAVKKQTVYKNKRWPHFNKNGDTYITLDEAPQKWVNWEEAPDKATTANTNQIAFVAQYDKNKDGKLDKTEFTGQYFDVYDVNKDGFIEALEAPEGATAY